MLPALGMAPGSASMERYQVLADAMYCKAQMSDLRRGEENALQLRQERICKANIKH